MNKLIENIISGELWMRTPSGKILPSNEALSALYIKYEPINADFNYELSMNLIQRFDFFYDSIFIETSTGFIFDKLKVKDNVILPDNNDDHLILSSENGSLPDYWLDEKEKTIYVTCNQIISWDSTNVEVNVKVYQFNITKNILSLKLSYNLQIKLLNYGYIRLPILEPCKISYNQDTRYFNISFILRGKNQEFGLISTNLKKSEKLIIDDVNLLLPYAETESISVDISVDKILETEF